MKSITLFTSAIAFALFFLVSRCADAGQDFQESSDESEIETPDLNEQLLSSAAAYSGDTNKRYIRTADVKFRVQDVLQTTYAIEQLTLDFQGIVARSSLQNKLHNTQSIPISSDSSLLLTHATMINHLSLFVPSKELHAYLRALSKHIAFLDFRIINATDVSLQLLAKQLKQKRAINTTQQLNALNQLEGDKTTDLTRKIEAKEKAQTQKEEGMLEALAIQDKVNWSEVNIEIYQRKAILKELIANEENISAYSPGFFQMWKEAIQEGWHILQEIILLLSRIWGLLLFALLGFWGYRIYKKKSLN